MLRRIILGLVSGSFLGAVTVVVASQVLPVTELTGPAPVSGEAVVPAGSEFNAERPDTAPVLPRTEGRPDATRAPVVELPDEIADAPALDTDPAGTPETGTQRDVLSTPQSGTAPTVQSPLEEQAVATVPGNAQPAQPGVDATPEPTAPLSTPQAVESTQPGLTAPATGQTPALDTGADDSVEVTGVAVPPVQPPIDASPSADSPAAAPLPADGPDEIATPAPEPAMPAVLTPDAPLGVGVDMPEFGELNPGLDTDRLPRIGADPEAPEDTELQAALTRFAVPFEREGGNPLMALVLIDDPRFELPADLTGFPVPLTVAIDPSNAGAGARMAAYRAAGLEVAVLTPLPDGATPADVEVLFQSYVRTVPQAVAVMDMPEALLQQSRPRAAQVVEILAESGLGLLTFDKGLNSGLQIAVSRGVPATTVFRVFDDGRRDNAAIKRFLDQGAFRAGQVGPVVLAGTMRADSIGAIAEWALGARAATVSLAPLSAILQSR